jgi:hypothetical protein
MMVKKIRGFSPGPHGRCFVGGGVGFRLMLVDFLLEGRVNGGGVGLQAHDNDGKKKKGL